MADKKSPLVEEVVEQVPRPDYSPEEEKYLGNLRKRLEVARDERDQAHDEFDGMDYATYYQQNERIANTYIEPKRNKEDTNFQSGIVRQKLFALLAPIINLNLSGDISAFDKNGLQIQALGDAMEDVVLKTNELDTDDEKKYLRHYELLKQGTVFVEELWDKKQKKEKKLKGKFTGKLNIEWVEKIKDAFARPTRNILCGLNVYLGDITKYNIQDQPFIFTVDQIPYEEAKTIFKNWERWDNVPRKIVNFAQPEAGIAYNWRLLQTQNDIVEIVRYQDKWNNEYSLLLNGVLMTPIGLPLPWGYEEYNVAQQNLEPFHAKFAYGKGVVSRVKNKAGLLDELMRLAVLKTQKSFMPPYINLSGRILSNRIFMPGKITHGIPANSVIPINDKESQGVTQSEFAMIKEIQESINSETVSPTFQGQQSAGDPTATEIIELQRQAKMVLGLTIFSVAMLEWKLEWLRLQNILANWFNEDDTVVDEARSQLKGKYQTISVNKQIEGQGTGRRLIIPTKEKYSPEAVLGAENVLAQEQGIPIRLIFLNPDEVCSSKLIWQIVIKPKERKTSEVAKLMHRAFLQDVIPLQPNLQYLQEMTASVWEENPQKLFAPNPAPPMPVAPETNTGSNTLSPRVNLPQPETALNRNIKTEMMANA